MRQMPDASTARSRLTNTRGDAMAPALGPGRGLQSRGSMRASLGKYAYVGKMVRCDSHGSSCSLVPRIDYIDDCPCGPHG
jgi:hypothetical protein